MKNNKKEELILFKHLVHRNLKECSNFGSIPNLNDIGPNLLNFDTILEIEYKINEHGYRGDNFLEKAEILSLGCSQTYGSGIPENFIWPNLFANKINKGYHNLATKGDSLQGQVYKAFEYFKEFGHPKVILGFFPINRLEIPYLPGISQKITDTGNEASDNNIPIIQRAMFRNQNLKKFSKLPYHPYDVISEEFAAFYNFMFIKFLDQYCETNKITLIWSFYDYHHYEKFIPEIKKNINSYIDANELDNFFYFCHNKNNNNIKISCHDKLKDHPLFFHASDCNHDAGYIGHWGIHTHQHIADFFYKHYIKIEMDK